MLYFLIHFIFSNFAFYYVNYDYVKYLHSHDSCVCFKGGAEHYFEDCYRAYLGIFISPTGYTYLIPLTSIKNYFKSFKEFDYEHGIILIYQLFTRTIRHPQRMYRDLLDGRILEIFGALRVLNMIPVKTGLYHRISITEYVHDFSRIRLANEYNCLKPFKDAILDMVNTIYSNQKTTGKILTHGCNFSILEKACDEYEV